MALIQDQLREKIQEVERCKKIRDHIEDLQHRLSVEEKSLKALEKVLSQEQRDVEKLEREGLNTMFRKFLGDREERLEKERQDYLKASLQFNEHYKAIEILRYELSLLKGKEENIASLEAQIEYLIEKRETEIMITGSPAGEQILAVYKQIDKVNKFYVEVDEAYKEGQKVLEALREVEYHLRSARDWGHRDLMGGSQQETGQMKHDAIDKAHQMVHIAKQALINFEKEIKDVFSQAHIVVNLEIGQFGKFADIFFDNLITDWIVQQKITKSLDNIINTKRNVEHLIDQLKEENGTINKKLEELDKSRRRLIVES